MSSLKTTLREACSDNDTFPRLPQELNPGLEGNALTTELLSFLTVVGKDIQISYSLGGGGGRGSTLVNVSSSTGCLKSMGRQGYDGGRLH